RDGRIPAVGASAEALGRVLLLCANSDTPAAAQVLAPTRAGRRSDRCDRSQAASATRQATDAAPGPFADRDFTREPRAHTDRAHGVAQGVAARGAPERRAGGSRP